LYPDPRRIETALPLTSVRGPVLEAAAVEWKGIFERAAGPRIALLVGGSDPMHAFTPDVARRMGSEIARMARRCGGSVFVTTSRRTRTECADALEAALGDSAALFHHWTPGGSSGPNPYMALLALADALIVTGESASMLAEACASGKPVWIYPLPEASSGLRVLRAAADAVASRALARPENRRGIERPQRGLERLCAKLVAEGIVPPFSEIRRMHEFLVEQGMARIFDENDPIPETPAPELEPSSDVVRVADAVRELVGVRTLR
jgi:mitochondrial fission protein ELM1